MGLPAGALQRYRRHRPQVLTALRGLPFRGALGRSLRRLEYWLTPPPVEPAAGRVTILTSSIFYSHFRLHMILHAEAVPSDRAPSRIRLLHGTGVPRQTVSCQSAAGGAGYEILIEALVDPGHFPDAVWLEIDVGPNGMRFAVAELLAIGFLREAHSLQPSFKAGIEDQVRRAGVQPRLLDLGGRARSGVQYGGDYPECAVTTFDIVAASGVDVVGDAHELSRYFPAGSFDFVLCISIFEHLLMPWKVALEMNRVMTLGGLAFIHTHQTIGMHDVPWDFLRFSQHCWPAFFNAQTGFEILDTSVGHFQHIVPRAWTERYRLAERSGGFESSSVLVRKTAETTLDWDVRVGDVIDTAYPQG